MRAFPHFFYLKRRYVKQYDLPSGATVIQESVYNIPKLGLLPDVIIADPPYGNITKEKWDTAEVDNWIQLFKDFEYLGEGVPIYWWGGIGKFKNRPLLEFAARIEKETNWGIRDWVTWKKKRAYGKSTDYLFVREECLVLTLGASKYKIFNKPYLDQKRGYAGFSKKYPAKSEYKRRGNVWDETELFRNKRHICHKAPIVASIPIEVHTNPGGLVLDLYAGSAEVSKQALRLGRKTIAVEYSDSEIESIIKYLS